MWSVEWLVIERDGERVVPALDFLRDLPDTSKELLLGVIDSVRVMGPDKWHSLDLHKPMKGDLADLHEARDKQGETLCRLFVKWQREEERVVLLDGRTKQNNTVLSDAEYQAIRELADLLDKNPPPFATVDDFARLALG
jgi:hypothetical protein